MRQKLGHIQIQQGICKEVCKNLLKNKGTQFNYIRMQVKHSLKNLYLDGIPSLKVRDSKIRKNRIKV